PRGLAVAGAVALVVLLIGGAGAAIGAQVADQAPRLRDQVRSAAQQVQDALGVDLPGVGGSGAAGPRAEGSGSGGPAILDQLASSLGVAADLVIGLFLMLAFLFLLLKNGARMWGSMLELLGGRVREDVDAAGRAAWGTLGAYVRGLTVVAAVDAVGIGIGLLILGVPLALTLALLQFVASYVPTIGAFVAGAAAVLVAWTSGGLGTAVAVAVLAVAVQQLGNSVVEPYVMQRELPLNAFTVLVAVTAGGLLWGIPGALLFVPLTAAIAAGGRELWVRHGRRPLAGGPAS
uniref:AI-2E family transporter n=1 Tax=Actinotalea sp. C106 TaxID=2908644 RepID=UPI002027E9DB